MNVELTTAAVNTLNVDSSKKRTFPHSSGVQLIRSFAQFCLAFLCLLVRRGFLTATHPRIPAAWRRRFTVHLDTATTVADSMSFEVLLPSFVYFVLTIKPCICLEPWLFFEGVHFDFDHELSLAPSFRKIFLNGTS